MFDIFIAIIIVALILFTKSVIFGLIGLAVFVALVSPGMYATLRGAPFVPTSKQRLREMLKLGSLKKSDVVYDLGCGNGKVIRAVAEKGVKRAIGYEFSIPTYFLAKIKSVFWGRGEVIKYRNFWREDYSDATVITCFLLSNTMLDFERIIWPQLKKGTRVVSNQFKMAKVRPSKESGGVFLYVKN